MGNESKYQDDKNIKWIIAQKVQGYDWQIERLGTLPAAPTLTDLLDSTPLGEMARSEFGVFRNRAEWWEYRPRRYYRGFEVTINLRAALGGLINALGSDWF